MPDAGSPPPPSDAGADAGSDAGADAGRDAGADAGSDAGADAGSDAGVDAGSDAGADAGSDAGADAGSDAGADAGSDAGSGGGRISAGVIALYTFDEGQGTEVSDTSGANAPLNLQVMNPAGTRWVSGGLLLDGSASLVASGPVTDLTNAIRQSNALTVEVWLDVKDLDQEGPARILTLSADPRRRNLMLGQGLWGGVTNRYSARLRTTTTNANGQPELTTPAGSVTEGIHHLLLTRDTAGAYRFYLDGTVVSSGTRAGQLSNWDDNHPLTLGDEIGGGRGWKGEYQLLAMYDRALTPEEVAANHAAGPDGDGSAPNARPLAAFSASAVSGGAPRTVRFDGSASTDVDGTIASYLWDFGDGESASGMVVEHVFPDDTARVVTLVVVDNGGKEDQRTHLLTPGQPSEPPEPPEPPATSGGRVRWNFLSSAAGELPDPGTHPQQTATIVFDVNGDGVNDFLVAGRRGAEAPSITWYERTAAGWITHAVEDELLDLEAGGAAHDIDGDGDVDFVLGEGQSGNDVWWWENPHPDTDPVGGWKRHTIKSSGNVQAHDQIFGDFDGDGQTELVFWNNTGAQNLYLAELPDDPTVEPWDYVSIFQGNGSPKSEGLASADVDGDGVLDIIGGGYWFKHVSGTNYESHVIDSSQAFTRVAAGQFIVGGRPEIIFDSGDAIGPLLMYSWDGSSWVRTDLLGEASQYGHSLSVGDIDGDGFLDILSAEMNLNTNTDPDMRVLFGNGAGDFSLFTFPTTIDNHETKLADLDGDGDLDILGKPFKVGVPAINVWLNDGPDYFGTWTRHVVDAAVPWRTIFVDGADMDGDGLQDIVTGGFWWRNPGSIGDSWARQSFGAPVNQMALVHDFDIDGDIDVLATWAMGSESNDQLAWGENLGGGSFAVHENVDTANGTFLQGVTIGRYAGPLQVALSWQNGTGGLQFVTVPEPESVTTAPWEWNAPGVGTPGESLDSGDIDGDGDTDILAGEVWFENNLGTTWVSHTLMSVPVGESDRNLLVDMDGDGDLDALIGFGHDAEGKLSWFEQGSDPTALWTEHPIAQLAPATAQSVDVADLDGDGDMDVVAGEHTNPARPDLALWTFENTPTGWIRHLVHVGDEHHDGAVLRDFDQDGDLDIVSIGWLHRRLMVYENEAHR